MTNPVVGPSRSLTVEGLHGLAEQLRHHGFVSDPPPLPKKVTPKEAANRIGAHADNLWADFLDGVAEQLETERSLHDAEVKRLRETLELIERDGSTPQWMLVHIHDALAAVPQPRRRRGGGVKRLRNWLMDTASRLLYRISPGTAGRFDAWCALVLRWNGVHDARHKWPYAQWFKKIP